MINEITEADLSLRNSFGVAATAARIVEFSQTDELCSYLASHKGHAGKTAVLGGGNNILFTGRFEGTLLHPVNDFFEITGETPQAISVRVAAGTDWNAFVDRCIEIELWGAENLAAIPGTVGAAPVQNIGAYGAEAKDIIASVEALDLNTLKTSIIAGSHCSFGYRDSIFKGALRGKTIITAVNFTLSKTPRPNLGYGALALEVEAAGGATLENIRNSVINIRNSKLPDPALIGSAGSFFKNPVINRQIAHTIKERHPDMPSFSGSSDDTVKIPAGWLIEQSGWKGAVRGNVGVYQKQALILVNLGGATGREVIELAQAITDDVKSKFGITIETEVNIW